MTEKTLAETCAETLRAVFSRLIERERPVALAGFPDTANCGAHAAWLGQKALLSALGAVPVYQCSAETYATAEMAARLGKGTILLPGMGMDSRDRDGFAFGARIVSDFPGNRIIIGPLDGIFPQEDCLARLSALLAGHRGVTLLARSRAAEEFLKRHFVAAHVELAPDMAFMLGPQTRVREPFCDIVWIARTDAEQINDETEAAARLASQAAEKFPLPEFPDGVEISLVIKQRPPTVLLTDWQSLVFDNEQARIAFRRLNYDARSEVYLNRGLYVLSLGHLVITDRLQTHVLCMLLKLPHILVNNPSGTNGNFHATWTHGARFCRLAASPAEAWAMARRALTKLKAERASEPDGWTWADL